MKTKNNPRFTVNLKLFLVLPVIFLFLIVFCSCAAKKRHTNVKADVAVSKPSDGEEPFVVVEEMPQFPGGETELQKYISENMKYPETAKKNKIQGKVIIRFCVTAKGNINLVTVLKGVDPELDAEAIRVVSTLPSFKPGKQGGKPVPVWFMVPVNFPPGKSPSEPPPPPPPSPK